VKKINCIKCDKRKGRRNCPAFGEKICRVCCITGHNSKECPVDCKYYPESEAKFDFKLGQMISWETGDINLFSDFLFLPDLYEHIKFELLNFELNYLDSQKLEMSLKFMLRKEFASDPNNLLLKESWKSSHYAKDEYNDEILYPIIGIAVPGRGLFSLTDENIILIPTLVWKGSVTHRIIVPPNQRSLNPFKDPDRDDATYFSVRNLFIFSKLIFNIPYDLKLILYGINEYDNIENLLSTKIGLVIPFGISELISPTIQINPNFKNEIKEHITCLPGKTRYYPGESPSGYHFIPIRGNERLIEGNQINLSFPCEFSGGPLISVWDINNYIDKPMAISILSHDRFINPWLLPVLEKFYGYIAFPVHLNVINFENDEKLIEVKSTNLKNGEICIETFEIPGKSDIIFSLTFRTLLDSLEKNNSIKIEVYYERKIVHADTIELEKLPKKDLLLRIHDVGHDWYRDTLEAIVCWVTPNNEKVVELVKKVKKRINGSLEYGTNPEIIIQALWNELKSLGFKYDDAPISIGNSQRASYQPINPPEVTINKRSGNCLELSILFASVLENLNLEPLIVLIEQHAFLGWEFQGNLYFLETTLIDSGKFDEAKTEGMTEYKQDGWKKSLKISQLRKDGFPEYFEDDTLKELKIEGKIHELNHEGWILFTENQNNKAKEYFLKSLKIKSHNPVAHNNLGVIYENEGEIWNAKEKYIKTLEQDPDYAAANNNLGNILLLEGKCDEALKYLNKAINLDKNYYTAYFNLGNTYYKCGKAFNLAIRAYKKSIAINPNYALPYCSLGVVYFDLGFYERSINCYNKAIELKPDYPEAYYNLGNVYARKSRNDEAIKAYEDFIKYAGDNYRNEVTNAKKFINLFNNIL